MVQLESSTASAARAHPSAPGGLGNPRSAYASAAAKGRLCWVATHDGKGTGLDRASKVRARARIRARVRIRAKVRARARARARRSSELGAT